MNILFVNYGDFTTNSLNHISGFANVLCTRGHACVVAVPAGRDTLSVIPQPLFAPATFAEVLAQPRLFPDGRPADVIHAWTPREVVRKFVLAYQRLAGTPARLIVHLEDNEEYLIERFTGKPLAELRQAGPAELATLLVDGLPHPWRHQNLLRVADGVTVIVDSLRKFAPSYEPVQVLPPGVDFNEYHPQAPDPALRRKVGVRDGEKVIVFTGGTTFANEGELRDLYLAVALLNKGGTPTRLVRTGITTPGFLASLGFDPAPFVADLGFVHKPLLPQLLALADVLVQPGRAGPFNDYRLPSKLPEFLASGRPVILPATNIAAQMEDGREALFLRQGSPEEIAALCTRVFKDAALARRLGAAGEAFARKHFDLGANTSTLETFYAATRSRPPLADWSALRQGGASEISLLAGVLQTQVAALPPGTPAAEFGAQLESLAHQLAQLERAAEAYGAPHAALAEKLAETENRLAVGEKQVVTLEKGLALTRQHADNLEKVVTELRSTLKQTEGRHAVSEKLLASSRRQFSALDHKLSATQLHVTNLENLRSALQLQVANLETMRTALERRAAELDAQCVEQIAIVKSRNAKIALMQRSFSWQVTAPLRFLRRHLVDRFRPKPAELPAASPAPAAAPAAIDGAPAETPPPSPAPEAGLLFSVDHPQSWSLPPRTAVLRGWCLAIDGRKLAAVRAILGTRTIEGVYGFKRLDVLASMRGRPQAEYCGWRIEVGFATGDEVLELEVCDEHGRWHRFFRTELAIGEGRGPLDLTQYEKWIEVYDQHPPDVLKAQRERAEKFRHRPLISVLMPVYNTPERWLRRAIESVRGQSYPHWELCIADDASPQPHIRPLLEEYARQDSRIKVTFREKNGHISAASNSALELATGEFVSLLDHDDELAPHALFEIAALLDAKPATDFIYSDEDKIDEDGRRHEPYFKPEFLPDLFHSQNYTSHLTAYRTSVMRAVGGFRPGYEGSQDWDLALRVSGHIAADRIRHIPKILYHWRAIPGSTALMISEKSYPLEAARRALTDHFGRLGQPVTLSVVPGDHWRVQYPLPANPPLASLVIPTRNGLRFLQRCVDSILEKTTYPNFEVLVVDNGSDEPATLAYLQSLTDGTHPLLAKPAGPGQRTARVLRYAAPFNYSAINNHAVKHARGELIGLLNNDLEVITPGWLDEMAAQALRPEIGCVGAMLYYPNDTIQHAGAVVGLGGVAGHAFRDFPRGTDGKFNRARLVQNYSAVTAACLVIRKSIYEQVGGLDENELAVAFNDIDFCLKVRAAGYRNLWTPFAELYHHESATRGTDDTPEKEDRFRREVETMMMRWGPELSSDPAYNANLTLELNDFSLAAPPRR
ncbi:MAG TPA: glycosyltransferase [Opitutaceae bacterium]|nr:glycosyltransferase [Opitutaceae bacterium]